MTTAHHEQTEAVKNVRDKYEEIMRLFDQYNKTDNKSERESLISEVSSCLAHVDTVEAKDLYPMLRAQAEPEGLSICEETHSQVRLVLDKLMRLTADIDGKDYEEAVCKLKDAVNDLRKKEENLFQSNEL